MNPRLHTPPPDLPPTPDGGPGHSKGPWSIRFEAGHFQLLDAEGNPIALIVPLDDRGEESANAHLIKAAPRMLDALVRGMTAFGLGEIRKQLSDRDAEQLEALCHMTYAVSEALDELPAEAGEEGGDE